MEFFEAILASFGTFFACNNLLGGILVSIGRSSGHENHLNAHTKPLEPWIYGWFALGLPDKRDPRSSDIKELRRQISQLTGNASQEAKEELERLQTELKAVRQQSVDAISEERRIDDLAKYKLIETDIANERILREKNARDIAESNREAFNAKRRAYELE